MSRLGHCVIALLRATDILICAIWLSALYPFRLADRPTGRETISAYVGKAARNQTRWGLKAARVIDYAADFLGDGPDHCYRSYELYRVAKLL